MLLVLGVRRAVPYRIDRGAGMSPPDAAGRTAFTPERGSASAGDAARARAISQPHYGTAHVVPVRDAVSSSGWLAEASYRGFEILVALTGLTLGLPVMLAEALLIRWDSPGPILFFHQRPGRAVMLRGRDLVGRAELIPPPGGYDPDRLYYVPSYFWLVKFRTMYHDARTRWPELYAYKFVPEEFHRQHTTYKADPRVTRIGRVLRQLSIDELPNLWCVLVGDMRLVGPRPEAPEVLQYYSPEEMYKFACKPGITGLAQINGRGLLNWGEVLAWDLKYIRTRTVVLDLKIIFTTIKYVLIRHGAF
jgi:lipopolysaccharide/colanic/teichoic acid biosynthesis glycosyltransferase